jgi:hypothetical protein
VAQLWRLPEPTAAGQLAAGPPNADRDGFVPLFNGKDLTGWKVIRTLQAPQTPLNIPEGWTVQDGTLLCTTQEFLWLRSEREYSDFHLQLEFQLPVGGASSGVYLLKSGTKSGPEGMLNFPINPEDKKWKPEWRTGGIWNVVAPKVSAMRPAGEWNQLEIHCEGSKVRVMLNSKITAELDVKDPKALKDRPRPGFIGLANFQGEGKGVAFRNLRIRELGGLHGPG